MPTLETHTTPTFEALDRRGFGPVDEHSGAYAYRIPVFVPPSPHGGLAPQLALDYNSMGSRGPSLIGAGWRLELGRIERVGRRDSRVDFRNNQGRSGANDHFILGLNDRQYTLVKLQNESNSFCLKAEQTFVTAKRFLSDIVDPLSGEHEITHWELYFGDGRVFRYGDPGQAGADAVAGRLRNKVWNLVSAEDRFGVKTVYEYEAYKNELNPIWQESAYSYPQRIKIGVTPDGSGWDSEIEFVYTDDDVPSEENGYYELGISYTGRENDTFDGSNCILWRRLTEVRTQCRNERGEFQLARALQITAHKNNGLFFVDEILDIGFEGQRRPARSHRFRYRQPGAGYPALMAASRALSTGSMSRAVRAVFANGRPMHRLNSRAQSAGFNSGERSSG